MPLEQVTSSADTSAFDALCRGRLSHLNGALPEVVLEGMADVISIATDQNELRRDWHVRTQQTVPECDSGQTHRTVDPITVRSSSLNVFIAFELSLAPEVHSVYTAFRDNRVFYVWVIVDLWEREVRQRIYARQQAIIDQFPDFAFDFYIVPGGDEDPKEIISQSVDLAYERHGQS